MYYIQIDHIYHDISESICDWFISKYLNDYQIELSILEKCDENDVYAWITNLDNEYEIEIERNISKDDFIVTLIHELIHLWQHEHNYQCENECYRLESILTTLYVTENELSHQYSL